MRKILFDASYYESPEAFDEARYDLIDCYGYDDVGYEPTDEEVLDALNEWRINDYNYLCEELARLNSSNIIAINALNPTKDGTLTQNPTRASGEVDKNDTKTPFYVLNSHSNETKYFNADAEFAEVDGTTYGNGTGWSEIFSVLDKNDTFADCTLQIGVNDKGNLFARTSLHSGENCCELEFRMANNAGWTLRDLADRANLNRLDEFNECLREVNLLGKNEPDLEDYDGKFMNDDVINKAIFDSKNYSEAVKIPENLIKDYTNATLLEREDDDEKPKIKKQRSSK